MARPKSQFLYVGTVIFIGFSSSNTMAGPCLAPASSYLSPLIGEVDDPAQGLRFAWNSSTYRLPGDMYWTFHNLLCNEGEKSLIAAWPKAGLYASAFSPLAPRSSMSNSFPGGIVAPIADNDSPIKMGYRGRLYDASTYQRKLSKSEMPIVMLAQAPVEPPPHLSSDLSLTYMTSGGGKRSVFVKISSDKKQNGYVLSVSQKTSDSVPLFVGLSMKKENRPVFDELARLDGRIVLTTLREFAPPCFQGLPCPSTGDELLEELGYDEFVFLPPVSQNIEVGGGHQFGVAQGSIVILEQNRTLVAAGKIGYYFRY
jgi:hypothetical protein